MEGKTDKSDRGNKKGVWQLFNIKVENNDDRTNKRNLGQRR